MSQDKRLNSTMCGHIKCSTCVELCFEHRRVIRCPVCRRPQKRGQVHDLYLFLKICFIFLVLLYIILFICFVLLYLFIYLFD